MPLVPLQGVEFVESSPFHLGLVILWVVFLLFLGFFVFFLLFLTDVSSLDWALLGSMARGGDTGEGGVRGVLDLPPKVRIKRQVRGSWVLCGDSPSPAPPGS